MADAEMTKEVSPTDTIPSVEINSDSKQEKETEQEVETGADGDGSDNDNENDNDAPGDNNDDDDEGIEVTDLTDGKSSGDLYKSFKAITEVLLNFKIKSRANE